MIYRIQTVDILGMVVAAMQFPVTINSITETEPNVFLLNVCDVYHAQKNFTVSIGGKDYKIKSVNYPSEIIVTGSDPITISEFEMYRPFYFHGTPIQTGVELNKKTQSKKVPMIWFMEQYSELRNTSNIVPIDRKINGQLYFLSNGDPVNWTTDISFEDGIKPMARLQEHFERQLIEMNWIFNTEIPFEYTFKTYHAFGVFIVNKGMPEQLWTDKLSGVEMDFTSLEVFFDALCKNSCPTEVCCLKIISFYFYAGCQKHGDAQGSDNGCFRFLVFQFFIIQIEVMVVMP